MDFAHVAILLAAGLIGGVITGLIGGASLVTFPALLATGLSPAVAIASNLAALVPANLIAAADDRTRLPPFDRGFAALVAASVFGAAIGAFLLLATPARMFEVLVPILLGFATMLFALSNRIGQSARDGIPSKPVRRHWTSVIGTLLPVSIYGGYFGAGVGVLLVAVLSLGIDKDYRTANTTKNLVTGLNCVTTTVIFAVQGVIAWPQTLVMMAGAVGGGLLGGRLARLLPRETARVVIIVTGAALTVIYAWRYWF